MYRKLNWVIARRIEDLRAELPQLAEIHGGLHAIAFDSVHEQEGRQAAFYADAVIDVGGYLMVPTRTLRILELLGIPYQRVEIDDDGPTSALGAE